MFFFFSLIVLARTKCRGSVNSIFKRQRAFCVYIFSSKHEGKLGGFKEVMQTLDTIKGIALESIKKNY